MLHHGDAIEVMAGMEPESVDAVVTDPPYGLRFMGKTWDSPTRMVGEATWGGRVTGAVAVGSTHPRGVADVDWHLMQQWHEAWAREALRVAKPSAYLLAFGGTRTVHRMTVALEDAGWIIRDMLVWAYASGFPKSKASLKPAWEPIVLARKPGPLRELAIDACRIPTTDRFGGGAHAVSIYGSDGHYEPGPNAFVASENGGRWPANLILTDPIFDGGVAGVVGGGPARSSGEYEAVVRGERTGPASIPLDNGPQYADTGSYSRFFVLPKADRADREPVLGGQLVPQDVFRGHQPDNPKCLTCGRQRIGPLGAPACECAEPQWAVVGDRQRENSHPTVKPTELMQHLVRLVTPPGGLVLDPFAGSGSTLLAAEREGFRWVGIEKEREYVAIAEARLNGTQRGLGLVS